jgi:predicted MFS family arabinose efflux permease
MATYTSVATVLGAVSLLAAPLLEKRLGFVRSIAFTRALGTVLLVVMAVWHNLDLALVIYALTPALRIAALPAQQTAITSRVHADDVGRALAVNQVARVSASSGAILCTGYLFDLSAVEAPFFIYAAVMAANIFLYFRFFPARELSPALPGDSGEPPATPTAET